MLRDNQGRLPLLSLPAGPLVQGVQSGLCCGHSCTFSGTFPNPLVEVFFPWVLGPLIQQSLGLWESKTQILEMSYRA